MAKGTTPTSPMRFTASCPTAFLGPTACWPTCSRSENKRARGDFAPRASTNSEFGIQNSELLERVAEAEHHHVDVRPCLRKSRRRLERRRDEVPAERLQVIGEAALSVRGRGGQDLAVHQTLADAPLVVQQVTEVGDVQTNLPRVTAP